MCLHKTSEALNGFHDYGHVRAAVGHHQFVLNQEINSPCEAITINGIVFTYKILLSAYFLLRQPNALKLS